jgi:hypothetical protein
MAEQEATFPNGIPPFPHYPAPREGVSDWFRKGLREADAGDDLAHGQIVSVAARWILVGAGLLLALWSPASLGPLRLQVLVLLMIAVANFYLHAQILRKRIAFAGVAYLASAADLAVITTLVLTQGGFDSNLWVFYFPAVLALSVAFPPALTALFAGATGFIYGASCFFDSSVFFEADNNPTVLVRLLMIAAVAVCGAIYRKVEAERRQTLASVDPDLLAGLRLDPISDRSVETR